MATDIRRHLQSRRMMAWRGAQGTFCMKEMFYTLFGMVAAQE